MKKKIISLVLCIVSIFALNFISSAKNAIAVDSYYSSVEGLKGTELLNGLALLTQENHKTYNTYGEVRYMYEADQDPNNPSNVLDLYSQISVSGSWDGGNTWNREHVWPKALSGGLYTSIDNSGVGAGADIHHIRPTIPNINSSRQDKKYTDFDYISTTGKENKFNGVLVAYDSTGLWEPLDNVKGDIARILLYLYMHYSTEVEANSGFKYAGNLVISNVVYTDEGTSEAAWDLLLDWNELDPVDSFERNRNIYCYNVTGVYNPFIDHPEYADMIFDESESTSGLKVYYSVDSDVTFEDLINDGYPREVIEALKLLTHNSDDDYFYYIRKVCTNKLAVRVKIADLKHNSDLSRLDVIDEWSLKRQEKYMKALKLIKELTGIDIGE